MIYRSKAVSGLVYKIQNEYLTVDYDGESKDHPLSQFGSLIITVLDEKMAQELAGLYAVYWYMIAMKERKLTLADKSEIAKILGITYGELETKIQHGQLEL